MLERKIVTGDAARQDIVEGMQQLARAVAVTYGPVGRMVALEGYDGALPALSRDGLTVARQIVLEDPVQNSAVRIACEAAEKTHESVGDGTTATLLMAASLVREAQRAVVTGNDLNKVCEGIKRGVDTAITHIRDHTTACVTSESVQQVAEVATQHDREIASLLAQAVTRVGQQCVVRVEAGKGRDSKLSIQEGLRIRGVLASQAFVTDEHFVKARLEHPLLMVHEGRLDNPEYLVPVLEYTLEMNKPLVIMASGFSSPVLAMLLENHRQGRVALCPVRLQPSVGGLSDVLDDLAQCSGAKVLGRVGSIPGARPCAADLGCALCIEVSTSESVVILGEKGQPEAVGERIHLLSEALKMMADDGLKESVLERLSMLGSGIALIEVGADSELESSERRRRAYNGLRAIRAAMQDGIVPGGGTAALRAIPAVEQLAMSDDVAVAAGVRSVTQALKTPAMALIANSGVDPEPVVDRIMYGEGLYGYDAARQAYGDLRVFGIVDPALVVTTALQNASSIAIALLRSQGICVMARDA